MMQVVFTRRGKTPPNAPCQENQRLPCSSAAIFTLFHIVMKVVYEKKTNKKKRKKSPPKHPTETAPVPQTITALCSGGKLGSGSPQPQQRCTARSGCARGPPHGTIPAAHAELEPARARGKRGMASAGGGAGRGLPDKGGGPHPTTARFPTALDSGRLRCGAVHSVSAASSRPIRCAGERPCLPRKFPLSLSQTHFLLPPPVQTAQSRSRSALFPGVNSDQFSLTLYNNPTPIAISLPL